MVRNNLIFLSCVFLSFTIVSSNSSESSTLKPFNFHEIIDLLPTSKIENLEQAHFKNDEGFRAAIAYLQSKEWRDLVEAVLKKPEYKKFTEMALKYNLDIPQAVKCLTEHIESFKVTERPTAEPNLEPFVKEVQNMLPIGALAKALSVQLDDTEAKKIHEEISSKDNQMIAEAMHKLPEMVKMREILKGMKFDVEPYIGLLYTFLGWVH